MIDRLAEIQDGILDRIHAGEPIDRAALLEEHAEHAAALQEFFSVVDLVEAPADAQEPAPSRLGDFRIIGEIGRGGMGVVYEAEQVSLRRRVALKILPPALRHDRKLFARFRREAEAAGRLRHPNVVPVFACGEAGGAPFFAMELVDGESLAEILERRRRGDDAGWPTEQDEWLRWVLGVAERVAEALHDAHEHSILHRDVKPGNIIIEADGTPRLTDFGLALDLEASALTVPGEVFGSPQYMSPEQAFRRERPLDARTDVYSLAVTVYEMLSLRLPYDGVTGSELLSALHDGRIIPLRQVEASLPESIERVLLRAMSSDPLQRHETAAAFAADLRAVSAGRDPSTATMGARPVQGGKTAARQPATAAGRSFLSLHRRKLVGGVVVAALTVLLLNAGDTFKQNLNQQHRRMVAGPAGAPTAQDLLQLIEGNHPDNRALLDWISTDVTYRTILARGAPAPVSWTLKLPSPAELPFDQTLNRSYEIIIAASAQVSVNGSPWMTASDYTIMAPIIPGSGSVSAYFLQYDLHDWIGNQGASPAAAAVQVAQRLRIKLMKKPEGWVYGRPPLQSPFDAGEVGTETAVVIDPVGFFVYDDYPADYPFVVNNDTLNAVAERAYTPDSLAFDWLQTTDGQRKLAITLVHKRSVRCDIPMASRLQLLDDNGVLRAEGELVRDVREVGEEYGSRLTVVLNLVGEPESSEQLFLLDLQAGNMESVELVFAPSRDVALSAPGLDRYWGGMIVKRVDVRE
jgi:hypothetical protein